MCEFSVCRLSYVLIQMLLKINEYTLDFINVTQDRLRLIDTAILRIQCRAELFLPNRLFLPNLYELTWAMFSLAGYTEIMSIRKVVEYFKVIKWTIYQLLATKEASVQCVGPW